MLDLEIILITFNRAISLDATLESISRSRLTNYKITIIDNASTDNTSEICYKYQSKWDAEDFKYIRRPHNVGGIVQIITAYEIASSEYFWIICDDDDLNLEQFDLVEDALVNHKPDILICGSPSPDKNLQQILKIDKTSKIEKEHFKNSPLCYILTFLPAAILKTEYIRRSDLNHWVLIDVFFPHFFWIKSIYQLPTNIYITEKTFVQRGSDDHGLETTNEHFLHYLIGLNSIDISEVIKFETNYYFSNSIINFILRLSKAALILRARGQYSFKEQLLILIYLKSNLLRICILVPLIINLFPKYLAILILRKARIKFQSVLRR